MEIPPKEKLAIQESIQQLKPILNWQQFKNMKHKKFQGILI
jgi:hypothetical protein